MSKVRGKAEQRALERFPVHEGASKEWIESHLKGICSDYIEGYHQAEEDLIDKAIGWIVEIYNCHEIMQYLDSCEPPLSELIEWFKNYMKEENINSK